MVEDRSKKAFKAWLAARPQSWRDGIEVVAMDGFVGFKTATAEELPDAVAVMDPFHVVRLGADAMDRCRGRTDDPLYQCRRTLLTGQDLLTDRQWERLEALFADERHQPVTQAWTVYQQMIALIDTAAHGIPDALVEIRTLARTPQTPSS